MPHEASETTPTSALSYALVGTDPHNTAKTVLDRLEAIGWRLSGPTDENDARLTMERVDRLACLRAAVAILQPFWAKREPGEYDAGDAITLARYIETGEDPYPAFVPPPSADAMRSHP